MKVLFLVTHLLGTGHLTRALTLARAFAAQGHQTAVISGGMPIRNLDTSGIALHQLPPVRSNGVDFTRLLDAQNNTVSDSYMKDRARKADDILRRMEPDIMMTELFPFGRRILKSEFTAVLETATARAHPPIIGSSIRDILAPPSKPAKAQFADDTLARYYDFVLCHSTAEVTPLDLSWPMSETIASRLHYTGFVAPPTAPKHPEALGTGEVLVSAGGGDVGDQVFDVALAAAAMDRRHWRLLIGGGDPDQRIAPLQRRAPANVILEPARPDFRQMLHHAAASVSLCGYNTALDVLQSGVPAVFVPFDAGNEVEQGIRADALAQQSGIQTLRFAELTPARLLAAVDAVTAAPARPLSDTGFDGAARSVRIVEDLFEARDGG